MADFLRFTVFWEQPTSAAMALSLKPFINNSAIFWSRGDKSCSARWMASLSSFCSNSSAISVSSARISRRELGKSSSVLKMLSNERNSLFLWYGQTSQSAEHFHKSSLGEKQRLDRCSCFRLRLMILFTFWYCSSVIGMRSTLWGSSGLLTEVALFR